MRILMINVVCGIRSTGRICTGLAARLEALGHEVKIAYGRENVPEQYKKYAVRIGTDQDVRLHGLKGRLLDGSGTGSLKATKTFIQWIKEYDPDIIHMHNIHGYYIHTGILFEYLKQCGKPVIWTLHDCWAFTGHAAFCEAAGCTKWQTGCYDCPKKNNYPKALADRSESNWKRKKLQFTGVPGLQIVTPSRWLAELVQKSFLKEYPVTVIHNGVDTSVFKKLNMAQWDVLKKERKPMILGVSALWEERKGLKDMLELAALLKEQCNMTIAGLTEEQKKTLPDYINGVTRTNSTEELALIYNCADVYVNPTYEDNYPTTNLEAMACGTPVVTYKTGGSPECLDYGSGYAVQPNRLTELAQAALQAIEDARTGSCTFDAVKLDEQTAINAYCQLYSVC